MRFKHKIRGEDWTIVSTTKLPDDAYGTCNYETKTIKIKASLQGKLRLDTIIHELLHASFPDIKEETVDEVATCIAKILNRAGYRRI